MQTEILNIDIELTGMWVNGCWIIPNSSGGYHGLLRDWFDMYKLQGEGLLIGERESEVKISFMKRYQGIKQIYTTDLTGGDINWDITTSFPSIYNMKFDFIICQAVLEHIVDPFGAIKNMKNILRKEGRLFIHTHGPSFIYHAFPIDCYRFFRDAFIAISKRLNLEIEDIFCNENHCFVVYREV